MRGMATYEGVWLSLGHLGRAVVPQSDGNVDVSQVLGFGGDMSWVEHAI